MRVCVEISLSDKIRSMLQSYSRSYSCPEYLKKRASIILLAEQHMTSKTIAEISNVHYNTVKKWRDRFRSALPNLKRIEKEEPDELRKALVEILSDEYRSGAPWKFDKCTRIKIMTIACQNPTDYGIEASSWSLSLLRFALKKEKIVDDISIGALYHILFKAEIKPWKNRYYLHSKEKYESYETYSEKVKAINEVYANAAILAEQGELIYCTDEMTGIQALEHAYPDRGILPGKVARMDFNYIRHGTTTLIGVYNVQAGTMCEPFLNQTRTDEDFVAAISRVVELNPDKKHTFILDNLNIHKSVSLVRYVAKAIGYNEDLGTSKQSGILKNMASRESFLTDKNHAIRFLYLPTHCSWLNQIEIWFGIMNKRLLKRKSFVSVDELNASIRRFIEQYNQCFAHPFKWTYDSVPEVKEFHVEKMIEECA